MSVRSYDLTVCLARFVFPGGWVLAWAVCCAAGGVDEGSVGAKGVGPPVFAVGGAQRVEQSCSGWWTVASLVLTFSVVGGLRLVSFGRGQGSCCLLVCPRCRRMWLRARISAIEAPYENPAGRIRLSRPGVLRGRHDW